MTWTKEWETGIAVIDKQHLRIVELINDLHYVKGIGSNRAMIEQVLHDLIDYTLNHFSFEEELQAQAGYPFAKAHKRVHEMFVKKVVAYQERVAAGDDVVLEVAGMLEKWLVNHINGDDADYAPLIKATLLLEDKSPSGWLATALGRFFKGKEA
jgi:hemerythrin